MGSPPEEAKPARKTLDLSEIDPELVVDTVALGPLRFAAAIEASRAPSNPPGKPRKP
jgi:hypothetical protein